MTRIAAVTGSLVAIIGGLLALVALQASGSTNTGLQIGLAVGMAVILVALGVAVGLMIHAQRGAAD